MQKEHFTLTIIKNGNQVSAICNSDMKTENLGRYLAEVLKEMTDLIPVFLDATGIALISDPGPELVEGERLEILQNIPLVSKP
jgi:hypothetical protein